MKRKSAVRSIAERLPTIWTFIAPTALEMKLTTSGSMPPATHSDVSASTASPEPMRSTTGSRRPGSDIRGRS